MQMMTILGVESCELADNCQLSGSGFSHGCHDKLVIGAEVIVG